MAMALSSNTVGHMQLPGRRKGRRLAALISSDPVPDDRASSGAILQKEGVLISPGHAVEEYALRMSVERHAAMSAGSSGLQHVQRWQGPVMDEAYERCAYVTGEYAKTFYLGTQLMVPEKATATWAIYVWCRRTDELVDGPNANRITPKALDRWEERLESLFTGNPVDILDAALTDTISRYPVDIQPFRDMVGGMRMDLEKDRYNTFDELYEYCYRVAGAVALMTTPVMGLDPSYDGPIEPVYRAALALGTANQLTNILRDVGEDASERGRIYVPVEDLDRFGISEEEVLKGTLFAPTTGKIDDRWRNFMKFQIKRARQYFQAAEDGVNALAVDARWPVWSALMLYRQILDSIEANDYNNFTKRAYVKRWKKILTLPAALAAAKIGTSMRS